MLVNKYIEKPAYIMGIPAVKFFTVPLPFIMIMIICIGISVLFDVAIVGSGMLIGFFLSWAWFLVLRWSSKSRHDGFLDSYIAYHFFQKRKIVPNGYKVVIKKKRNKNRTN